MIAWRRCFSGGFLSGQSWNYGGLDENKKKLCGITQLFIYLSKY